MGLYPFGRHEGLALEFKEARESLPKTFFETICAFLNMDGGLIVLGVADDGTVMGVAPDAVNRMTAEIASLSNNPMHFTPFPKNPTICRFMSQMGRYEELGSGVRNVTKYHPFYAPGAPAPIFLDEDMFTTIVPLVPAGEVTPEVTPEVMKMLAVLQGEMTRKEIQERLGLSDEKHFRVHYQQQSIKQGLVEMTISGQPKSRLQKYRLTDKGQSVLASSQKCVKKESL